MSFANHVLDFNKSLALTLRLPDKVEVLYPFHNAVAVDLCTQFYTRYYNDKKERTLILGINPGRFGGGVTGIPFTDPIKLESFCGITNSLQKKAELSADFMYRMITAYGGPAKFYSTFYISSISPLGFTKDGKNLNYYDIKELKEILLPFIIDCLHKQFTFGINREVCFCLGEGENATFLGKLNKEHKFFKTIIALPHPRFIMQYRRKRIDEFVEKYIHAFSTIN